MSLEDPVEARSIPQGLADAMALAATKCWIAYKEGRPWLGDPEASARLTDECAKSWIECFQKGYLKEVERRQRAALRESQPIDFLSMPIEYQRALASRWLGWRDEILMENPGLAWNSKLGFHWESITITTSSGESIEKQSVRVREINRPVMWKGRDIRSKEMLTDLLAEEPL